MSLVLDGSLGVTFPNTTTQASAGSIIQVVNVSNKNYISSSTTTYIDLTGYSASITPKFATSKILVRVGLNGLTTNVNSATSYEAWFRLVDGSGTLITGLFNGLIAGANENYGIDSATYEFLHSPATTSTLTYKIQGQGDASGHGFQLNNYGSGANFTGSYITLMEIAA